MVSNLYFLSSDDEEVSLVVERTTPEAGHPAEPDRAVGVAAADALSVGHDMPDLPLDAPPDPDTSGPEPPLDEEYEDGGSPQVEEEAPNPGGSSPQVELEEVESNEQQGATNEEGAEEEQKDPTPKPVEEASGDFEEPLNHPEEETLNQAVAAWRVSSEDGPTEDSPPEEGPPEEGPPDDGPPEDGPQEAGPQEDSEGGSRSSTTPSLTSSRRKNRPCSLPVSELETVIASACGEPETPRSHYIRIHHLLHSLPSAQQRAPSQEEEDQTTSTTLDSTSPTVKTSKDQEGQEDEDEEDTTHSSSQVGLMDSRHLYR